MSIYLKRMTRSRAAFTLIEVMVSIAVALILLLGVNQVFKASSELAGSGQALSHDQQLSHTVKQVITNDLKRGAWDSGVLAIRCEQRYAFRNSLDRQGAQSPDPSQDPLWVANGGTIPAYIVNRRSHRIDRIGFFARGLFSRQTTPPNMTPQPLTVLNRANEAWIWFGHLSLPNNKFVSGSFPSQWFTPVDATAGFFSPGDPNTNNDNNFDASDWILGRFATLLGGSEATDSQNPDTLVGPGSISPPFLAPLTFDSFALKSNSGGTDTAEMSLHDFARTSISDYTTQLAQFMVSGSGDPNWMNWMIGYDTGRKTDHRYRGVPFIPSTVDPGSPRVTPVSLEWLAPCMAKGCAQFIVEYAGNYLTQNDDPGQSDDGKVLNPRPDPNNPNHIDYVMSTVVDPQTNTTSYIRKIRWYGFPRDVNGQPGIQYDDVLPLRDVIALSGFTNTGFFPPFESFGAGFPPAQTSPGSIDYSALQVPNTPSNPQSNVDTSYACGWGAAIPPFPNKPLPSSSAVTPPVQWTSWPTYGLPKLLRITIALDDGSGRLADAQFYEFVIDLRQ